MMIRYNTKDDRDPKDSRHARLDQIEYAEILLAGTDGEQREMRCSLVHEKLRKEREANIKAVRETMYVFL